MHHLPSGRPPCRGRRSRASVAVALLVLGVVPLARAQDDLDQYGVRSQLELATPELDACSGGEDLKEDERVARASEHFNRGRELYEQGSYARSVEEFAAAYCHAPNPAPLKNIAQAYERLIEYDKAVVYLERYILELPDSEAQERQRTEFRRRVLERQPARIRVATLPAGAKVTLLGDTGPVASTRANGSEPLLVQRGRYVMRIEADGYETIEEPIETDIGRPYSYYFRLDRLTGGLNIKVSPASARIFLDKKLVGIGSYVSSVPIGSYSVLVESGAREPQSREVEVGAGRTTTLNVSLKAPPRSGRRELLVASSAIGGVLGGASLASVFDSDPAVAGLASIGGLGVGFLGGYFGIPEDVSQGTSSLIIGSTVWGATEGLLLTALISCDVDQQTDSTVGCAGADIFFGAGTLAGVAALVGSAVLAPRLELSAGDAGIINSGATWGLVSGALLWSTFEESKRARDPLLLAGLNLGLVASGIIATQVEVSRARTALIDLCGLGGVLVGVAAAQFASEAGTDVDRSDHFALIGMATGLISGAFLTRGLDDSDDPPLVQPTASAVTDAAGRTAVGLGFRLDL